jgi:RNA polymerase sigma factor (TIGR02999 family)
VDETADQITGLLNLAAGGDAGAARRVFPAIYGELRRLASAKLARQPAGGTLRTTALVHEAYLRIVGRNPAGWENIRHFYFTAARAMRDILVEDARRRSSRKRGGGQERVPLDDVEAPWGYDVSPEEVLALDAALEKLEKEDEEGHRLVLLRFYAGLTNTEIAELLEASVRTVERKWRFLRVWLVREMETAPGATSA